MKFDSLFSLTLAYACSYFRDTRCDTSSLPSDERAKRDSTREKSPLFEDHGRVSISSKEVFALWPQSNTRGKRGLPFTLEIFPASRAFERGSRTFYQASSPPPPSCPPCSRWPGKSARKRKRISGLRDPARRECNGEASKKCGQIVSPRHTDRCKEIISVSKPHEPFDRSFQPFSPSVSASRFTETSARSRSPVSSSRSTFLLLLSFYISSRLVSSPRSCTLQNEFCLEIKSRERKRPTDQEDIPGRIFSLLPLDQPMFSRSSRFLVPYVPKLTPFFSRCIAIASARETFRKRFLGSTFRV